MGKKYTLDNLMRVTGEVTVDVRGRKVAYYLRTLGHAANDARRNYSMDASRRIFMSLRDIASAEYARYIAPIGEMADDELRVSASSMKQSDFRREAISEVHPADNPGPAKDASIKELVEAEIAVDEITKETEIERERFIERLRADYTAKLADMSHEDLVKEVGDLRINVLMAQAFDDAYNNATLYWSVFTDVKHTKRLFSDQSEAAEADELLRDALLNTYYALDVFSVESEALKN